VLSGVWHYNTYERRAMPTARNAGQRGRGSLLMFVLMHSEIEVPRSSTKIHRVTILGSRRGTSQWRSHTHGKSSMPLCHYNKRRELTDARLAAHAAFGM
jgi:hypothetical protein